MNDTMICEAGNCDHPADGGYICRTTLAELEQMLAETAWLVGELDNALSKQTAFISSGGKVTTKGAEQPLIFNPDASDVLRDLTQTMLSWQANLADAIGVPVRYPNPIHSSMWLLGNIETIRTFIAAGDLHDEILDTIEHAKRLIDRPAERRYLGDCGATDNDTYCGEPLWGKEGDALATCKVCGTAYLQEARVKAIHEQASTGMKSRIMTASAAAACIIAYDLVQDSDETKMTDRIRKWAAQPADPTKSPKLVKRAELRMGDERARPGYRFGDIIDILNDRPKKKSA